LNVNRLLQKEGYNAMNLDDIPGKKINNILTAAAVLILMLWAWEWFGPGSADLRHSGGALLERRGMGFADLLSLGVAVACGGYLLWRFLSFFFWRKYFNDEKPPDAPDE